MREIFKDAEFNCPIFCPTEERFSARFIKVSDAWGRPLPSPPLARRAMSYIANPAKPDFKTEPRIRHKEKLRLHHAPQRPSAVTHL